MCSRSRPMTVQPTPFGSPPASGSSRNATIVCMRTVSKKLLAPFPRRYGLPRRLRINGSKVCKISSCCSGVALENLSTVAKHLMCARFQFRQSLAIFLLLIDGKRRQRAIDEINNACLVRSRRIGRGNNPRRDRIDLDGLRRSEKTQLGGFGSLYCVAGVRSGGGRARANARKPKLPLGYYTNAIENRDGSDRSS